MNGRYKKLRIKAIKEVKKKIKKEASRKDLQIIQVIKSIDMLDKTSNLLFEQLRDWYTLQFPLRGIKEDMDSFIERVCKIKGGENSKMIGFSKTIKKMRSERKKLERHLEKLMKKYVPNLNVVAGTLTGARLLASARSLKKLAGFPSSTIQVLGAEKALFSHLRKGTKPPKHGIIFHHPRVRSAPYQKRGRIARKLASKISMAAKIDYFGGESIGKKLVKEFERETQVKG